MKYLFGILILLLLNTTSCSTDTNNEENISDGTELEGELYFPPINTDSWETIALKEINWNVDAELELFDFLRSSNSKAFLILNNGKIAIEWYADDFSSKSPWYWASAGKTLTSFTIGIAEEEGFLKLTDKSSDYLGQGWTSIPLEKENLITVKNQLTMTTGLDDTKGDCKTPDCLTYVADAGTRWGYHNAPYTLLQDVVSFATQTNFETYFTQKLKDRIGMTGTWISTNGENNVYWSTARSMARFGLLNLNNGVWDQETILGNEMYLNAAKNTSQDLNKSYGYLWWLNGKESAMVPQSQLIFNSELISNAPADLYAGLGKDDQKLYVIPSENMVVVRLGEDTGNPALGPSSFDNDLWEAINKFMN